MRPWVFSESCLLWSGACEGLQTGGMLRGAAGQKEAPPHWPSFRLPVGQSPSKCSSGARCEPSPCVKHWGAGENQTHPLPGLTVTRKG